MALFAGPSIYCLDVAPCLAAHDVKLPPVKLPTVSQVVTMITDAYGHAIAQIRNVFNVTLDTPKLEAVATVDTNETSLANLGFQASLLLSGLSFSIDQANSVRGPDKTIFTWDVTLATVPAGPFPLTAGVIFSL